MKLKRYLNQALVLNELSERFDEEIIAREKRAYEIAQFNMARQSSWVRCCLISWASRDKKPSQANTRLAKRYCQD